MSRKAVKGGLKSMALLGFDSILMEIGSTQESLNRAATPPSLKMRLEGELWMQSRKTGREAEHKGSKENIEEMQNNRGWTELPDVSGKKNLLMDPGWWQWGRKAQPGAGQPYKDYPVQPEGQGRRKKVGPEEETKSGRKRGLPERVPPKSLGAPSKLPQNPPSIPPPPARPLTERVEKVRDLLDATGDDLNVLPVRPVLVNLPLHRVLLPSHGCRLRKSDCAGAPTPQAARAPAPPVHAHLSAPTNRPAYCCAGATCQARSWVLLCLHAAENSCLNSGGEDRVCTHQESDPSQTGSLAVRVVRERLGPHHPFS